MTFGIWPPNSVRHFYDILDPAAQAIVTVGEGHWAPLTLALSPKGRGDRAGHQLILGVVSKLVSPDSAF